MNYSRILLSEIEKKRILGLHNSTKKNPTTSLINEALTINDFPICVRTLGSLGNDKNGNQSILVKNAGNKGRSYYYYSNQVIKVDVVEGNEKLEESYYYYCQCVNGKCSPKITKTRVQHECSEQKPCKQGGEQKPGGDCKNKTPYQVVADLGLNFKDTQKKWVESGCMGTTPCSIEEARTKGVTNINLKNALCGGKWKPGDQNKLPINDQACKEKCSQQPKEVPPGAIVTQQIGYFYDSTKGECVGVTGQNGPFTSIEECKKCNCGNKGIQDNITIKLPTLPELLDCVKLHLKLVQLPTSCQVASGGLPTDPTKCFQELLNGKTIALIIEFLMCLFPGDKIPSPIDQIPIKIPDEKNPGQEIEVPIIKIPGVDVPIFQPPLITPIKPKD
jgi:hypothetical protein